MEIVDGITEQELRQDMADSRLRPDASARSSRVYRALRQITDEGSVFYVLEDTPDQYEDVLGILVDDKMIVDFELTRGDPDALPMDVNRHSVEEYRETITDDFMKARFRIALELARRDLGR